MARRRSFLAELQRQSQIAARQRQQATTAAARQQLAAQRAAERAAAQAERARAAAARASAAEQKRATQEAHRLHLESMEAEAASRNAELASRNEAVDSLLAYSVAHTTALDLEQLRATPEHLPFSAGDLETPMPSPQLIVVPPEPVFVEPPQERGLFAKKHHAQAVASAKADYETRHQQWQEEAAKVPGIQLQQMQAHQRFEAERVARLSEARAAYDAECQKREQDAKEANEKLDALIAGVARDDKEALETYVSLALGNSAYPDEFTVEHDFDFDPENKELKLTVTVPGPTSLSTVKEYRYNRTKDEIVTTELTSKQIRDRYLEAICAVALRTLHDVFTSDADGHVRTIALSIGTEDNDPATGLKVPITFLAVAADRETFSTYDLSNVVPLATLKHMRALVSRNPYEMEGIDESRGVRSR